MSEQFDKYFKTREQANEFRIHSFDLKVVRIEKEIDVELVAEKLQTMPSYFFLGLNAVVIDRYNLLAKRGALAVADEENIYISSLVENEEELYTSILHEIAHRLMRRFNKDIFSDGTIEQEFLAKREYLFEILESQYGEDNLDKSYYKQTKYNKEFDQFLAYKVGYGKLTNMISGLFVSPYAATSLEEYFARSFEEFFSYAQQRNNLTSIAPSVYTKIEQLMS